jgi:Na+/proline symporter
MSVLDWAILASTILGIAGWGIYKTRKTASGSDYVRGSKSLGWPTIGLSVMATQASAITFLSVPGQAYDDGLRFVQFYFGMPLAVLVVSAVFLPFFAKQNVVTAYEYLEKRFDVRLRVVGALLFLTQRGLAAGITIYAPAIILSSILGLPLTWMNLFIGIVVIAYTVSGGTEAVSQTQKQQMIVILLGMVIAGVIVALKLPSDIGVSGAATLAGATDRMIVVDTEFDLNNRYNLWSGLMGGFFLALSYFGTDQSQVQRYLSGKSISESRFGLLFNAVLKIPMQFGILFVGILLYAFHVFVPAPLHFNPTVEAAMEASEASGEWAELQGQWDEANAVRAQTAMEFVAAENADDRNADYVYELEASYAQMQARMDGIRDEAIELIERAEPTLETKDTDYVFIGFVLNYMPVGLVGLLVAVILMAAMSSTASELSALGTTTSTDLYQRLFASGASERRMLVASKGFTMMWGVVALLFATWASLLDNLIEAVNILGSIFYGPILGMFLVAFMMKRAGGTATLIGAAVGQVAVLVLFFTDAPLGFLWYNVVGCLGVLAVTGSLVVAFPEMRQAK